MARHHLGGRGTQSAAARAGGRRHPARTRPRRSALLVTVALLTGLAGLGAISDAKAASGPPASLVMYPLPDPNSEPYDLKAGPDGNLWLPFNNYSYNSGQAAAVGRITPSGAVTQFTLGSPNLYFPRITAGADGNLWLLGDAGTIDKIPPDGSSIAKYPFSGNGGVGGITLGPDGNVWFTEINDGHIGRVTPAGTVTEFTVSSTSHPFDIVGGPDGNLWFTDPFADTIGQMSPAGVVLNQFPTPDLSPSEVSRIARGPDGNLWYTKPADLSNHPNSIAAIGRITTAGVVTEFMLPVGADAYDLVAGPDGNLWFTDQYGIQIGRITRAGQVGVFSPGPGSTFSNSPANIAAGPDGRLWFTMASPARVGAFAPFAPAQSPPDVRNVEPHFGLPGGGNTVIVTGYNVGTAKKVLFGSVSARFQVLGPSTLRAVVPKHAIGEVSVTVVTPTGTTAARTPADGTGSVYAYQSPQCGRVVSSTTALTADLGPCYTTGLVVTGSNITVDLGGHRVFGFPGPSEGGGSAGIHLAGATGVTVKNGTVTGFDAGMFVDGGVSNLLTGLTLQDNIGPDDPFNSLLGDGIFIQDSGSNVITHNTISHNGIFDGIGIYLSQSTAHADHNDIENNVIENIVGPSDGGPSGQGIIVNGATGGLSSTTIAATRIASNTVRDNASGGIANINTVLQTIVGNTVVGNGTTNSLGNGIGVSVGPLVQAPTQALVQGNDVHGNGVDGIRVGRGARGNTIQNNDAGCGPDDPPGCVDNGANPAADTYEGSPRGFDLDDQNTNCAGNVWAGNSWGKALFNPPCTAAGGTGPPPPGTPTATPTASAPAAAFPNAQAWQRLLLGGRL